METYVTPNREYTLVTYLATVSDTKLRRTLTKYRLSEHNLAVELGRHRAQPGCQHNLAAQRGEVTMTREQWRQSCTS